MFQTSPSAAVTEALQLHSLSANVFQEWIFDKLSPKRLWDPEQQIILTLNIINPNKQQANGGWLV